MSPRTAPPSASSHPRARRVDVREWLGGIRLSGFAVIMLALVVLAVFALTPTLGTYLDQRRQIDAIEAAIEVDEDEIADLEAQREEWTDSAYITTQARERLYYTQPGELVYLVDNDLSAADLPRDEEPVSDEVEQTRTDWMTQLVRTVTEAGLSQSATPSTGGSDEIGGSGG